jgi:hypothetical protein
MARGERSRVPERADVSGWRRLGTWPRCRWRAVEGYTGPVVAHGGAGIGVAGGFLHIAERNPSVEGGGDERVAEGVGPDALGYPRPSSDATYDPSGRVTIDPHPIRSNEDRSLAALTDHEIDSPGRPGRQGDGHNLAPLAQNREGAVPALQPEVLDNRADRFRYPQPVEGQQADQRVIPRARQSRRTSRAPTSLRSRPVAWDS